MLRLLLILVVGFFIWSWAGEPGLGQGGSIEELWSQLQQQAEQYLVTPTSSPGLTYLATGDSVAAGEDLGANCTAARSCADRQQAYPALVASMVRASDGTGPVVTDVSCTGATTSQYLHDAQCGFDQSQASYLPERHVVITITVGADDLLSWIGTNRPCVLDQRVADLLQKPAQDCDLYAKVIQPLESNLREILRQAAAGADLVLVTQYYHVFSPSFSPAVTHLPYNWTEGVNEAIDLLDSSIASVAAAAGPNVVVVDLRPVFATHEWGDSDSYIARLHQCAVVDLATPWSECWWVPGIHPNASGQQAIADEVWAQAQRRLSVHP